jgi:hypothetical protein
MTQPSAHDPLGRELVGLITKALAIKLTPSEESCIRRIILWSDRPDAQMLASLIDEARKDAAEEALRGTLWSDPPEG